MLEKIILILLIVSRNSNNKVLSVRLMLTLLLVNLFTVFYVFFLFYKEFEISFSIVFFPLLIFASTVFMLFLKIIKDEMIYTIDKKINTLPRFYFILSDIAIVLVLIFIVFLFFCSIILASELRQWVG
jgi:hypothetical protein